VDGRRRRPGGLRHDHNRGGLGGDLSRDVDAWRRHAFASGDAEPSGHRRSISLDSPLVLIHAAILARLAGFEAFRPVWGSIYRALRP